MYGGEALFEVGGEGRVGAMFMGEERYPPFGLIGFSGIREARS